MYFARSLAGIFPHGPSYALRAAFTAASTSASLASAMRASFCSLAGLMVSKYFPLLGFTHLPPMNSSYCSFSLKWSLLSGAGASCQSMGFFALPLVVKIDGQLRKDQRSSARFHAFTFPFR
jgi:hypothetical protein